MKLFFTSTILLFHLLTFGQIREKPNVREFPIPNTLNECFSLLDKTLPDSKIALIETLPEDSIFHHAAFKNGTDFFHAWKLDADSRLVQYFNKLGLHGSYPIYNTILLSYHRYLNKNSIKLDEQIKDHQVIQKKKEKEYLERFVRDTLDGNYIPRDLKECFIQLDKILPEKGKIDIKNLKSNGETMRYHHGLGTTIRNRWRLWGGSRLRCYFLDKGISHPDSMSALILVYYYDWLNNKNEDWQKWAK